MARKVHKKKKEEERINDWIKSESVAAVAECRGMSQNVAAVVVASPVLTGSPDVRATNYARSSFPDSAANS